MERPTYILDIINKIEQYPEFKKYYLSLTEDQKFEFLRTINELDVEHLYQSPIHGKFHSEKVLLFTYLLAIKYNYSPEEIKILSDAAMYHDMGRRSDINDTLHGFVSANLFAQQRIFDEFYKDPNHLKLVQAIMDAHSFRKGRTDASLEIVYYNNGLDETDIPFERFKEMAHIIMDADALDRKRFSDQSPAALNADFLHFPESKEMVGLAEEINEAYRTLSQEERISLDELYESTGAVAHSIGFVFPRVVSVLTHGILSSVEMKKRQIETHRNFLGGNSERWISVVPTEQITNEPSSVDVFLHKGIVVIAQDVTYYETPYTNSDASIAILKNLPFNKSDHDEERYVLDRIEPDKFTELYISSYTAGKDLSELQYIFPNLNVKVYQTIISDLCSRYKADEDDLINIRELYARYKTVVQEYIYAPKEIRIEKHQEYAALFERLNTLINQVLGRIIKKYYVMYFHSNPSQIITPVDVLRDELTRAGITFEEVMTPEKISFIINKEKRKDSGFTI